MNAMTFDAGFAPSRIRLVDIRHRQLLTAQLRMLLLAGGFALVAFIALIRIAWLGVVQPAPTEHSRIAEISANDSSCRRASRRISRSFASSRPSASWSSA